jgi:hypothetical protein
MEDLRFDFDAFIEAGRRANEEAEKEETNYKKGFNDGVKFLVDFIKKSKEKDKDKTLEKAKEIIFNFDKYRLNFVKQNKVVYCEFAIPEDLYNKFYIFVKECEE